MSNPFFDHPVLNSPYEYPTKHWELDDSGQPTQKIIPERRAAKFVTPIPKPKKHKKQEVQASLIVDKTAESISTKDQQYKLSELIGEIRSHVATWRSLSNPKDWKVTPETARLLQHWRHHKFSGIRPFFCQLEAVEVAIWLTEVAPKSGKLGQKFLDHLENANAEANPGLNRLALKLATGAGKTTVMANLFVIFGEPDIAIIESGTKQIQVKVRGVDIFDPSTGQVRSNEPDEIACWFIDTDYDEESFFVRHAYFLGANDPYKALKTSLKAEVDQEVWESLHSDTSRPFDKPKSGRIAVKVINHLGDEVMKVYRVL